MRTIALEVRDEGTHIPVIATALTAQNDGDSRCLRRAGFPALGMRYVLLTSANSIQSQYDPENWPAKSGRTMREAHKYIANNFDLLNSGDVVDVEFILGETPTPKLPEVTAVPTSKPYVMMTDDERSAYHEKKKQEQESR